MIIPHYAQSRKVIPLGLIALIASALLTGCNSVHRRMSIRSDPPDALVIVDGKEIGYTPTHMDFTYYGTREIKLVKDGFETLTTMQKVKAPAYQWVGPDFITDNFLPFKVTDRHDFQYRLQPQRMVPTNELLDRANSLRSESQFGQ